jgi:hypothetical protein
MIKNFILIGIASSWFACNSNSNSTHEKQKIKPGNELKNSTSDSCQILSIDKYLNDLDFPLKKEEIFDAKTLRENNKIFRAFNKCDYLIFHLDSEKNNGLDYAAYISDYGIINGSRVILIFVQYPNQYFARLVSFQNNSQIDKLDIAMIGFEEPPCDIKFKSDSVLFKKKISKATLLKDETIETKNVVLFKLKNLETNQVSENIGHSTIETYKIDSTGHFILKDSKKTEEDYYKSIYECY